MHEPRVELVEDSITESEPLERTGTQVLHEHVAARDQPAQDLGALRGSRVEPDAAFVAINREVVAGLAGIVPLGIGCAGVRRTVETRGVAGRRLDLDDVGPEVAEQHRAVRPRQHRREVRDHAPGQRPGPRSWLPVRAGVTHAAAASARCAPRRPPCAPPPLPPGWTSGPPDYVGVGTARAGTTWWDELIRSHPDVVRHPDAPKEVHFFDGLYEQGLDAGTTARYHGFFGRPDDIGAIAGVWTPGYIVDAWAPALLHEAAPDARLLVLLRDPVERFRSGRTLAENRFTVGSTARAAANAAFNRGLYADQLLRLWRVYPREQVLVLQYERCVADTQAQLRATFAFLDLDPDAAPVPNPARRINASRGPKVTLNGWQEATLRRRYGPENERLAALLPDLDIGRWGTAT